MTDVYRNFEELNQTDNKKAEEALRANGLQFTELDAEMVPQWRRSGRAGQRASRRGRGFLSGAAHSNAGLSWRNIEPVPG